MGEQPQESATGLGQLSSVDQPGLLGEQPQESATDRLVREFGAVVSLPEAPDSMCLSVLLDGEPIYEHRAGVALIPASLMKIVTAAAAVEVLRLAHTFTTEVHVRSDALESAEGGVLWGDIYVVGRGDPVLSTPGYVDRHSEHVVHTDVTELAERVSERLVAHGIRGVGQNPVEDRRVDFMGQARAGLRQPGMVRHPLTAPSRRNSRSDRESEQRHSRPRSESMPSK